MFDVSALTPQLACPNSVENVHPLTEVLAGGDVALDQGYIGSCTGGREEDIEIAAAALEHRFPDLAARSSPFRQGVLGHGNP